MAAFETIRFPLIFGTFLLSVGTAYIFRKHLIPEMEDEQRKIFIGSDENRKQIHNAIEIMK